jgi:hypothetical protein
MMEELMMKEGRKSREDPKKEQRSTGGGGGSSNSRCSNGRSRRSRSRRGHATGAVGMQAVVCKVRQSVFTGLQKQKDDHTELPLRRRRVWDAP